MPTWRPTQTRGEIAETSKPASGVITKSQSRMPIFNISEFVSRVTHYLQYTDSLSRDGLCEPWAVRVIALLDCQLLWSTLFSRQQSGTVASTFSRQSIAVSILSYLDTNPTVQCLLNTGRLLICPPGMKPNLISCRIGDDPCYTLR